jgi:2-hydroxy-3-keto-5-methylthiopentenyl-1-phosphate phosphatase
MRDRVAKPILFLDFDGTISCADVVDRILERHADRTWLDVEEQWRSGQIGSRECLARQMALVSARPAELDALVDAVEIDEGFPALLEVCDANDLPVHIISDGFDYCIERILARVPPGRYRRPDLARVYASHLEPAGDVRWSVTFPFANGCEHGCATCKPAVMQALNPASVPALFVGDGLSDRYAAAAASVVFAKSALAVWCGEHEIAHVPYVNLGDVAACIDDRMAGALIEGLADVARARA